MSGFLVALWSSMIAVTLSSGAMIWIETHMEAKSIPRWLWWLLTVMFFGGIVVGVCDAVAMTVYEALAQCVPDQSALAGVCVPIDQAG